MSTSNGAALDWMPTSMTSITKIHLYGATMLRATMLNSSKNYCASWKRAITATWCNIDSSKLGQNPETLAMLRCCRTQWQIGSRGRCSVSYISNITTECIRNGLRSRLQPLKITSEELQLSRRRSHCSAKQRRPASQLRFRLKSSTPTLSEKPRRKTHCNRRTLIDWTMGK